MALNQVPQPAQSLNATQGPILANFATIDTAFSVDHVTYGSADQGIHQQTTFPVITAAPFPITTGTQNAIYCGNNALLQPALFYKGPNSIAAATGVDFTTAALIPGTFPGPYGYGKLPSGLTFAWGQNATVAMAPFVVDTGASFATAMLSVFLTIRNPNPLSGHQQFISLQSIDNFHQFTVFSDAIAPSSTAVEFNWYAIGY